MVSPALETAASQTRTEDQFREERAGHLGAKYTPGPWHIEPLADRFLAIKAADGETVECVSLTRYDGKETKDGWERSKYSPVPHAAANARLMAAAPELLEALQAYQDANRLHYDSEADLYEKGLFAIAKATGEQA